MIRLRIRDLHISGLGAVFANYRVYFRCLLCLVVLLVHCIYIFCMFIVLLIMYISAVLAYNLNVVNCSSIVPCFTYILNRCGVQGETNLRFDTYTTIHACAPCMCDYTICMFVCTFTSICCLICMFI